MLYIASSIYLFLSLFFSVSFSKIELNENNVQTKTDYEKIGAEFVAKYNTIKSARYFDSEIEINRSLDTVLNDFQAKWYGIKLIPTEKYSQIVDSIGKQRQNLKKLYDISDEKDIILDSVKKYFTISFLNTILPHWYGTEWAMNGSSQIPQEGFVGCSYFVANTMYDMGFNFERVKVAQASSRNIARTFQLNENVVLLKSYTSKEVVSYIKQNYEEGLFIVGLDYHTAFILYHKNEVFLIHSSRTRNKVAIEFAVLSKSFISNHYYIGEITTNDSLMVKWLNQDKIPTIEVFEFGK